MTPARGSAGPGNGGLLANEPRKRSEFFNGLARKFLWIAAEEPSGAQAPCLEPDISQVKDIREVSEVFVTSGLQIYVKGM